jgi:hypothetical protein
VLIDLRGKSQDKLTQESIRQRRIIGRAFVTPSQQALEEGVAHHAGRIAAAGTLNRDMSGLTSAMTRFRFPSLKA